MTAILRRIGVVASVIVWLAPMARADTFGPAEPLSFGQIATLGGDIIVPSDQDVVLGALVSTGFVRRGRIPFNRTTPGATVVALVVAPPATVTCNGVGIPVTFVTDSSDCVAVTVGPCIVYVGATLRPVGFLPAGNCDPVNLTVSLTIIP